MRFAVWCGKGSKKCGRGKGMAEGFGPGGQLWPVKLWIRESGRDDAVGIMVNGAMGFLIRPYLNDIGGKRRYC